MQVSWCSAYCRSSSAWSSTEVLERGQPRHPDTREDHHTRPCSRRQIRVSGIFDRDESEAEPKMAKSKMLREESAQEKQRCGRGYGAQRQCKNQAKKKLTVEEVDDVSRNSVRSRALRTCASLDRPHSKPAGLANSLCGRLAACLGTGP